MDASDVEQVLGQVESALAQGGRVDLRRTGFWRAVAAVKLDRVLVDRYAERIATIDRSAFERSVWLRLPAPIGVLLDLVGVIVGGGLMAVAPVYAAPAREICFLIGVAAILGASHTLAHWVVGTAFGIRFSHWFSKPPLTPQPGFKVDYASYLRTPARRRAAMHASGAIVTKLIPFAAYPVALAEGLDAWALWVLLIVGVAQLLTDALLSTGHSDWKRFRREWFIQSGKEAARHQ
jgi:hypothetical protein